jgi:hypothetical protein
MSEIFTEQSVADAYAADELDVELDPAPPAAELPREFDAAVARSVEQTLSTILQPVAEQQQAEQEAQQILSWLGDEDDLGYGERLAQLQTAQLEHRLNAEFEQRLAPLQEALQAQEGQRVLDAAESMAMSVFAAVEQEVGPVDAAAAYAEAEQVKDVVIDALIEQGKTPAQVHEWFHEFYGGPAGFAEQLLTMVARNQAAGAHVPGSEKEAVMRALAGRGGYTLTPGARGATPSPVLDEKGAALAFMENRRAARGY